MDSTFLPVTVVVAILLFALKECFELVRRYQSESRTKKALRALLAFECERNHFTIKNLRGILEVVRMWNGHDPFSIKISLKISRDNEVTFHQLTYDDGAGSQSVVRTTHRDFMSKQLLTVATLDADLYKALQPALDAVNEMEHVRQSLIAHMEDPERTHLAGFAEYALEELDVAYNKLNTLYVTCTGKKLESYRIR